MMTNAIAGWINNQVAFKIVPRQNAAQTEIEMYRVFIGNTYRTSKKTLKGALGVVRKIGTITSQHETEAL